MQSWPSWLRSPRSPLLRVWLCPASVAIAAGLNAWGAITAERLLVALSRLGGIVGLLLIGHLDVVTATAVIAGSLVLGGLAYLPLLGRGMSSSEGPRRPRPPPSA